MIKRSLHPNPDAYWGAVVEFRVAVVLVGLLGMLFLLHYNSINAYLFAASLVFAFFAGFLNIISLKISLSLAYVLQALLIVVFIAIALHFDVLKGGVINYLNVMSAILLGLGVVANIWWVAKKI